jgi:hypothetical protein
VLQGIFEHFSLIDEATKKRLIKAQYVLDMLNEMCLRVDRKDIDISIKKVKSNLNSLLTYQQFVAVLEDISVR